MVSPQLKTFTQSCLVSDLQAKEIATECLSLLFQIDYDVFAPQLESILPVIILVCCSYRDAPFDHSTSLPMYKPEPFCVPFCSIT